MFENRSEVKAATFSSFCDRSLISIGTKDTISLDFLQIRTLEKENNILSSFSPRNKLIRRLHLQPPFR